MNTRRLLLSPLWLLIALLGVVGPNALSAAAGSAAETRVRAIPTATADTVGQPSSETAGHVGCLRPSQPGFVSGSCVATEAAASAGSTGRTVAANLTEKLAMEEVVSGPAGSQIRNIVMSDARWPAADGWVKMQQILNGLNIHYVFNTITKAVDDFKFAGGAG